MRVLHVVLGLEIGGLETFVLDLTQAYASSVTSVIVCLRSGDIAVTGDQTTKIVEFNGPDAFSISLISRLVKLIRKESIDLVHTHNPGPHLYGAIAARLCGKPILHTKHGRNFPMQKRRVLFNRIATLLSDRIVAVSEDAARVCSEVESVPERKLCTILNGIDTEKFVPRENDFSLREALSIPPQVPIIGIVARLNAEKNHSLLFRGLAELHDRGVEAALCVVGDGPLQELLKEQVRRLGLENSVHFIGARSNVNTIYPQFDVFALTSTTEGISLTLLEAMSCELPVVATAVGGNPEVVENNVTGLIIDEAPKAVAEALFLLLSTEGGSATRAKLGTAGRRRVLRLFNIDKTAAAYVTEYHRLR